ncbi:MAG: transcription termination/antitermination protein NusA [Planctomycetia bacterium]|nr:transcription termination/antitermination protein NusA [Planctomycetia bacterium]
MNSENIMKLVEQIHIERGLSKETILQVMEQALAPALRRQQGGLDDSNVRVSINRQTGEISAIRDNIPIKIGDLSSLIGVQTTRQIWMQRLRDAERDMIYDHYHPLIGSLVTGDVYRVSRSKGSDRNGGRFPDGSKNDVGRINMITVRLGRDEAILPRSEMVPGEIFREGDQISAVVRDVSRSGSRVKIVLSRKHDDVVRRLLELECPEIADGVVEIKAVSRDPHRRSKVAVATDDPNIDLIGACVGTRGARTRAVTDALQGERIDIVLWSDDLQEFIRNALRPANIDEVILCPQVGRALVVLKPEQKKPAIGTRGQNVRLVSKLCQIDLEIMTSEELDDHIFRAKDCFATLKGVTPELIDTLTGAGCFTFYDLSVIEPDFLQAVGGLTREEALDIIDQADKLAEEDESAQGADIFPPDDMGNPDMRPEM